MILYAKVSSIEIMLITHKKPDELTDQHVINLCNKYRSKFLDEEEQRKIDALNGTLEK